MQIKNFIKRIFNHSSEKRHHVIISGTGRAGTTFLVQLFTKLGMDTGFSDSSSHIFANCNAGMEYDLRQPGSPYIVKNPYLCDYLGEVLQTDEVIIDHALIPVRDLFSAAESRRDVVNRTESPLSPDQVPGGLWHTTDPENQETILTGQLYKIIYTIAQYDIPITLLYFPRLITDPQYLFKKIKPLLPGTNYHDFLLAYHEVCHPRIGA